MAKPTKVDFKREKAAGQAFYQRWKELQKSGTHPFVLSRSEHPVMWQAWRAYYRSHGLWSMLDIMDDGRTEKTVPCLNPVDFEPLVFVEVSERRVKDD